MNSLPRIRSGLLRHPLDEQVLVYDTTEDRVHLLDPTTACVMELLETGENSEQGVMAELARRLNISADSDLVFLAIEQLRGADLLEPEPAIESSGVVSRREVVRKLAAAGIAGVLVPAISTFTASRAYAQGTVLGVGAACTASSQCLQGTGRCCGGTCRVAACSGNNQPCGAGVNPAPGTSVVDCTCCSGVCATNGGGTQTRCT